MASHIESDRLLEGRGDRPIKKVNAGLRDPLKTALQLKSIYS